MDYDAREYLGDSRFLLNREKGRLVGGSLALVVAPASGLIGQVRYTSASGLIDYQGLSQFGLPVATKTRLALERLQLAAAPANGWSIGPGRSWGELTMARQQLDRSIRASPTSLPLRERIVSWEFGVGAGYAAAHHAAGFPLEIAFRLSATTPLEQHLTVDSFGEFDEALLRPAARASGSAHWEAALHASPDTRIGVAYAVRWMRFGPAPARSLSRDGQPVGQISYPGSRQTIRSILVHVSWSL